MKIYSGRDIDVFESLTREELVQELARCHDRLQITHVFRMKLSSECDSDNIDDFFEERYYHTLKERRQAVDQITALEVKVLGVKDDGEEYIDILKLALGRACTNILSRNTCVYCRGTKYIDDGGEYTAPTVCTFCPPEPTKDQVLELVRKYIDDAETQYEESLYQEQQRAIKGES